MTLELGDRLGEYEIRGVLGSGGMGTVHRAWQPVLRRDVAIKVLQENRTGTFARRFEREVEIHLGLSHPNLVKMVDAGNTGAYAYLVMELVEGHTLADEIRGNGVLARTPAMGIARDLADALTYLHAHEIVHRDLKPANVMIGPDGRVKLMDFGLAHAEGHTMITKDDHVVGTMRYIPPEALLGPVRDPRADVHALGVVLFEMLTGRVPFMGSTMEQWLDALVKHRAPLLRELSPGAPPELESLLDRMLQKDPARRPTAREVLEDLEEMLDVPASDPAAMPPAPPHSDPAYLGNSVTMPLTARPRAMSSLGVSVPSLDEPSTWRRVALGIGAVVLATGFTSLAFLAARRPALEPPRLSWPAAGALSFAGRPEIAFRSDRDFRPMVKVIRGTETAGLGDATVSTSHALPIDPDLVLHPVVIEVTDEQGRPVERREEEGLLARLARAQEALHGTRAGPGAGAVPVTAFQSLQDLARAARWTRPMNQLEAVMRGIDPEAVSLALASLAPAAASWYGTLGRVPACVLDSETAPLEARLRALEVLHPPRILDRLLSLHGAGPLLGAESDLGHTFATAGSSLEARGAPTFEVRRPVLATLVPVQVEKALGNLVLIDVARRSDPLVAGAAGTSALVELEGGPPGGIAGCAVALEIVACNSLAQAEAISPAALVWATLAPGRRLLLHGGGGLEVPHEGHRDFRLLHFFDPALLETAAAGAAGTGKWRIGLELEPIETGGRTSIDVFVREVSLMFWKEPGR